MKILNQPLVLKILNLVILFLVIWGFYYFEPSLILRILIIALCLGAILQFGKIPELLILVNFYLGFYFLYNIRYSLAIPMAVILVAAFMITILLFYSLNQFIKYPIAFDIKKFNLFLVVTGLVILEIFLTMSLWPVDPNIKSLSLTVSFYLIFKIVYLELSGMLNLKKIRGFAIVSFLILSAVISVSWLLGF
ncbi:MAG: hypothetical protein AAB785_03135 [Patescibacteria group bacterium]